jgi:glycosyltransferase involved in cell wall biosynthesis
MNIRQFFLGPLDTPKIKEADMRPFINHEADQAEIDRIEDWYKDIKMHTYSPYAFFGDFLKAGFQESPFSSDLCYDRLAVSTGLNVELSELFLNEKKYWLIMQRENIDTLNKRYFILIRDLYPEFENFEYFALELIKSEEKFHWDEIRHYGRNMALYYSDYKPVKVLKDKRFKNWSIYVESAGIDLDIFKKHLLVVQLCNEVLNSKTV